MTIYISGPITGLPNNNKSAFKNAVSQLLKIKRTTRFCTLRIINPLSHIAIRIDKQFAAKGKRPEWTDYMRGCIKKLTEADCVLFLDGWAQSEGATMERYIAKRLDIPCADNITELKKILEAKYENS